jgi:hypothetical protein
VDRIRRTISSLNPRRDISNRACGVITYSVIGPDLTLSPHRDTAKRMFDLTRIPYWESLWVSRMAGEVQGTERVNKNETLMVRI